MKNPRNDHVEREARDEIAFHIERRVEDNLGRGMSPEDARSEAARRFGDASAIHDELVDLAMQGHAWKAWRGWTADLWRDVRIAARGLSQRPGFTTIAVLTLALGIGGNTAIFSLVDAVLLRTLPVRNPEELVVLTSFSRDYRVGNFAYPDYERLRDGTNVFSGLLAASSVNQIDVELDREPERVELQIVSGDYFSVLGVTPYMGRLLEDEGDRSPVAVVSHAYAQRRFAGLSPVGKTLTINGTASLIVGVAPTSFVGESVGRATDVWVSMEMTPAVRPGPADVRSTRSVEWLYLMGRLKPGMDIGHAQAEAGGLVAAILTEAGADPATGYLNRIEMERGGRGSARLRDLVSAPLFVLMGVVALVLMAACTNLASLLLAHAAARRQEIATRMALGASRFRLIRQLLAESVLLAALGGVLGLLVAAWSGRALLTMVAEATEPIALDLGLDGRILLFTALLSVSTGVLFGLAPALKGTRHDITQRLKAPARPWPIRNLLVVAQVALSLVLMVGCGLFVRTLGNLMAVDPGFEADRVLLVQVGRTSRERPLSPAAPVLERLAALPGVQSASYSLNPPLREQGSGVMGLEIPGYTPVSEDDQRASADWVGPRYFATLGIPLARGRDFSATDAATGADVVVVNQTMARHYFGERSPLGQSIRFNGEPYEIIGVARDARYRELSEATPRMIYFSATGLGNATVEVRAAGSPLDLAGAVRATIREAEPQLRIVEIATLTSLVDRKLTRECILADVLGFFSFLCLLLVSVGVFGTLTYAVAARSREIGVRLALGAKPGAIRLKILREVSVLLTAGLLLGLPLAIGLGRLVASLLFGVTPTDPMTIATAALLLCGVALAAGYIPALRASRLDPVAALRTST